MRAAAAAAAAAAGIVAVVVGQVKWRVAIGSSRRVECGLECMSPSQAAKEPLFSCVSQVSCRRNSVKLRWQEAG